MKKFLNTSILANAILSISLIANNANCDQSDQDVQRERKQRELSVQDLINHDIERSFDECDKYNTSTINSTDNGIRNIINIIKISDDIIVSKDFRSDLMLNEKRTCERLANFMLNDQDNNILTSFPYGEVLDKDFVSEKNITMGFKLKNNKILSIHEFVVILLNASIKYSEKFNELYPIVETLHILLDINRVLDISLNDYFKIMLNNVNENSNNVNKNLKREYIPKNIYENPKKVCRLLLAKNSEKNMFEIHAKVANRIGNVVRCFLDFVKLKDVFENLVKSEDFCNYANKINDKILFKISNLYGIDNGIDIDTSEAKLFDQFFISSIRRLIIESSNWLKKYTINAQLKYTNDQDVIDTCKKEKIARDLISKNVLISYLNYVKENNLKYYCSIKNFNIMKSKINNLNVKELYNYLCNNLYNIFEKYKEISESKKISKKK